MILKYSYNTNGLRHIPLIQAIREVKEAGYSGLELSLHQNHLHPFSTSISEIRKIKNEIDSVGLELVCISTGADNLLSEVRFEPSLISSNKNGRTERIKLINEAIHIARELEVKTITFASGFKSKFQSDNDAFNRLTESVDIIISKNTDMIIAIEPEPDMFIGTTSDAIKLIKFINHKNLMLNLDIGHVYCSENQFYENILQSLPYTVNIHIEDIRNRIHKHEIPGEGDINFYQVLKIILDNNYSKYLSVELYDHSSNWRKALYDSISHLIKNEHDILNSKYLTN